MVTKYQCFQHTTTKKPEVWSRLALRETATSKSLAELPESYTEVTPSVLLNNNVPVPDEHGEMRDDESALDRAIAEEVVWLENVKHIANQKSLQDRKQVSLSAHHSNKD